MIEQIEKNIFFKVTRIFAWLIIAPAFLILLYSGYKSLKSLIPLSSPVVTYDEVKSIMEGKANYSDFEGKKSQKSAQEDNLENNPDFIKAMKEIVGIFGQENEKRDELINKFDKVHTEDFVGFLNDLISVVKSAPENKRPDAAITYLNLWLTKEIVRSSSASSDVLNKPIYLGLLAGSLSTISVFSLVLILLTIEKNTRKTEKSQGETIVKPSP